MSEIKSQGNATDMNPLPVIEGDVGFVTGAASGFGLAISKELVSHGAYVIMADVNEEGVMKAAGELNEKAGKTVAIALKVDTRSFEEQLAAYEKGKDAFGRVDYFFANAGIAEYPWLPPFDPSSSSRPITKPDTRTLDIDLNGQLNTAALALQVFERQPPNERSGFRGKLVMTASVLGYYPCKSMPMYAAAKAGIVNFMRSSARYYGDGKGVTVNLIAPNITATSVVPPDFMALFSKDTLSSMEVIMEQIVSLLGSSKDNGRAISISGKMVWDHPEEKFMWEENKTGVSIVEDEAGRRLGLWL